jgi:hypothetical protein
LKILVRGPAANVGKQDTAPSSADRKSRRRRLPISGTLGAPLEWSPDASDWRRLETAYSKLRFDSHLRAEIEKAVEQYLYDAPFEVAAPAADDFMKSLVRARELAKQLEKVVHSFGTARSMVARHWERYFPREDGESRDGPTDEDDTAVFYRVLALPPRIGRDHRNFSEVTHAIFLALDGALRDVARPDSAVFSEGNSWSELVIDLALAFRSSSALADIPRARRATATKDPNRPRLSPFVRFVKELQATFNEKTLRRYPTGSAISEKLQKDFKKEIRQLRQYMPDARLSLEISQALSLLKARERGKKRCASAADLRTIQAAIAAGRWRQDSRSRAWAGYAVASALKLDANDTVVRSEIGELLKTWIKSGMLVVVEGLDDKRERRSYVEVGRPSA